MPSKYLKSDIEPDTIVCLPPFIFSFFANNNNISVNYLILETHEIQGCFVSVPRPGAMKVFLQFLPPRCKVKNATNKNILESQMRDETVSKVYGLHHSLWPTPLINFLPKGIMSLQSYDWHFGYSNLKFGLKAKHSWQTTFAFPQNAIIDIHNHVHPNFLVSRSGKAGKIVVTKMFVVVNWAMNTTSISRFHLKVC